jgi:hypothetical protein
MFNRGAVYYLFAETLEDFLDMVTGYSDDGWFIFGSKIDPVECGFVSEEALPVTTLFGIAIRDWVQDKMSKLGTGPRCVVVPVSLA